MIKCFQHKRLQAFFDTGTKAGIQPNHAPKLQRQLVRLDDARGPEEMNLPDWRMHSLSGDFAGYYSVTVKGNCRMTFTFENGDAVLVDYQGCHEEG